MRKRRCGSEESPTDGRRPPSRPASRAATAPPTRSQVIDSAAGVTRGPAPASGNRTVPARGARPNGTSPAT